MGNVNKNLKQKMEILTWLSFAMVILTSWANVYEYGPQVLITIMLNEVILLAFSSLHHVSYLNRLKENFNLASLLFTSSDLMSAQSVVIKKQSIEIEKLKRIIDGQTNNVGSI